MDRIFMQQLNRHDSLAAQNYVINIISIIDIVKIVECMNIEKGQNVSYSAAFVHIHSK